MTTTTTLTFADWQLSRRIVPWTIVHDWDEVAFQQRIALAAIVSAGKRVIREVVAAFQRFVEALRPFVHAVIDTVTAAYDVLRRAGWVE